MKGLSLNNNVRMPTKTGSRVREYGYHPQTTPRDEKAQNWRGRLSELYNTHRWRKERKAFIQWNPLCAECQRNGKVTAAQVVDHIIPHPVHDFWDKTNWQPLCKSCNNKKGEQDKKMLNEYYKR